MLIGLHGRKQAGKDTVYARIAQHYGVALGHKVERRSFADLLYRSAAAAIGLSVGALQDLKTESAVVIEISDYRYPNGGKRDRLGTIREYLQRYGTEAHREMFGQDFWTDQVDLEHDGKIVVVTDVRFPNEAERIRANKGWVVEVTGPPEIENAGDGHASEAPLPRELVDASVNNSVRNDKFRSLDGQLETLVRLMLREETP